MFKAFHTEDNQEIIILDVSPDLETLRESGRLGHLVCPVCRQPVSVKAGQFRQPHFAHKELGKCPSSHESAELLQARAAVYCWLRSKFPSGVTLEKRLDTVALPRSIDCWVETPKGRRLAYWIIDRRMSPNDRERIMAVDSPPDTRCTFVFLAQMMQRNGKTKDVLNLTTTERDLLRQSNLDVIYDRAWSNGSLHYIDATDGLLTTFRSLHCTECPQQFTGVEVCSAMASVQVQPSSGGFVHPGEWDRLEQMRKAREEAQAQVVRQASSSAFSQANQAVMHAIATPDRADLAPARPQAPGPSPTPPSAAPAAPPIPEEKEGVCIFCGQRTRSWWSYDGGTGRCKCYACRQAGRL